MQNKEDSSIADGPFNQESIDTLIGTQEQNRAHLVRELRKTVFKGVPPRYIQIAAQQQKKFENTNNLRYLISNDDEYGDFISENAHQILESQYITRQQIMNQSLDMAKENTLLQTQANSPQRLSVDFASFPLKNQGNSSALRVPHIKTDMRSLQTLEKEQIMLPRIKADKSSNRYRPQVLPPLDARFDPAKMISASHATNPFNPKKQTDRNSESKLIIPSRLGKDWAEALKQELQHQSSIETDLSSKEHKINYSRFMKSPVAAAAGSGISHSPSFSKNSGVNTSFHHQTRASLDSGSVYKGAMIASPSINLGEPRKSLEINLPNGFINHDIDQQRENISSLIANSRAHVHSFIKDDILEENKLGEIGKIIKKKLNSNEQLQQADQILQFQSSPRNHQALRYICQFNEQDKARKIGFKRDRMLSSVQKLFDKPPAINSNQPLSPTLTFGIAGQSLINSPSSSLVRNAYISKLLQPKVASLQSPPPHYYQLPEALSMLQIQSIASPQVKRVQPSKTVLGYTLPLIMDQQQNQAKQSLKSKFQNESPINEQQNEEEPIQEKPDVVHSLIENIDVLEPIKREPQFEECIAKRTEVFQNKVDNILDNNTYIQGCKDVQIARNKNPHAPEVYQCDFEMKMAKIEDSLEWHMTSIGEQILSQDRELQDEYEQGKIYSLQYGADFNGGAKSNAPIKRQRTLTNKKGHKTGFGTTKNSDAIKSSNASGNESRLSSNQPMLPLKHVKQYVGGRGSDTQRYTETNKSFMNTVQKKQFINRIKAQKNFKDESEALGSQTIHEPFSSKFSTDGDSQIESVDFRNFQNNFIENLAHLQNSNSLSLQDKAEYSKIIDHMVEQQLNSVIKNEDLDQTMNELNAQKDVTAGLDYQKKKQHQTFVRVAQEINQSLQFQQLAKSANSPEIIERMADDPKFKLFLECRKEHVLVLPIFQRIRNKTLNLSNYPLSGGLAKAFGTCFMRNDTILNRVIFDNNGMKDEDCSHILQGLNRLQEIKSIIYNNNEFGTKSAQALQPMINYKHIPYHLEELRLMNCRISTAASHMVLDALMEKNFLKKLALVNASINNDAAMEKVCQIVDSGRYLVELDLSWNSLRPSNIIGILSVLSENRQLQFVNLSWNNLMEKTEVSPLRSGCNYQEIIPEETVKESIAKLNAKQTTESQSQKIPTDSEEYLIYLMAKISRFIKYNKSLLHFDLSYTGLSEQALRTIGASLKRGRSILSLHLSGNPGINQSLKDYLFNRIKCREEEPDFFNTISPDALHGGSPNKSVFQNAIISSIASQEPLSNFVKDGVEVSQILNQRKLITLSTTGKLLSRDNDDLANDEAKLIFERWVGHKEEMPGSGQWRMLTKRTQKCWVCDKQIFTVIFWSRTIGISTGIDLDFVDKDRILEQIEMINKDIKTMNAKNSEMIENTPKICGSFNNWKYQAMVKLETFLQQIDKKDNRYFLKLMKERGRCGTDVKSENELLPPERDKLIHMIKEHHERRRKYWRLALATSLKYNKRPLLISQELVPQQAHLPSYMQAIPEESSSGDDSPVKLSKINEEVWVLPLFVSAGKHIYFVNSGGGHYVHKFVAPFRDEDIPVQVCASKVITVERRFKKETSVFRDWKEDTPYIICKCCESDQKEWKASRFIKDPQDAENCWKVIEKNFCRLKDIFLTLASKSNFPSVTLLDFSMFAEQCKIYDKVINISTIDRQFIATNVEQTKSEENPAKELLRYEFFELLLRIANCKFRETGFVQTYSEALEKLIKEHVFMFYKSNPWQEFRDKHLWTVDVNDVLEANLEGLRKVYAVFFDPRKKFMSMSDALDLMIRLTPVALTEKDAFFCYGMSKMTVANEVEESTIKYKRLQFVELLEMVGRIAEVKFRGTEMDTTLTLAQKIEFVLDDILPLGGAKRKDVKIVVEEHSESDDEY